LSLPRSPSQRQPGPANWPDSLTIGAASPGGTYYIYGAGLARVLTRDLDVPVIMRPTEGPAENMALFEAGESQLAFVTVGVALQAWNGTGVWAGKAPGRSLRAVFPMYDTPFSGELGTQYVPAASSRRHSLLSPDRTGRADRLKG
jgi:TRAP-type uncharacterized transport system substrate-binding protein